MSSPSIHSFIQHLTYWALGCVRFCEQQRRQTQAFSRGRQNLQLHVVRRATLEENHGTQGEFP